MPCVSLQRKPKKFQEEPSDLETQLLELGFLCEDWNAADPDSLLETETFTSVTAYDALNRATSIKTPHNSSIPASEILPGYNCKLPRDKTLQKTVISLNSLFFLVRLTQDSLVF